MQKTKKSEEKQKNTTNQKQKKSAKTQAKCKHDRETPK